MRHILALVALGLIATLGKAALAADKELPNYSLKDDVPDTGSSFRRNVVGGAIVPLDKRYSELSAEEKAILKSQYDGIGPNDEPPFPVDGLLPIYRLVADGQRRLQVTGSMVLSVDVDSGGDATSVSAPKSADPDMVSLVASILIKQKYKPGTCNGIPCNMQFPVRFDFTRRH
jgi:hypothetical protein